MAKTLKILGKRGRVTIPFEIRQRLGFKYNDILSFEDNDVDTVTVKREVLCNHCSDDLFEEPIDKPDDEETLRRLEPCCRSRLHPAGIVSRQLRRQASGSQTGGAERRLPARRIPVFLCAVRLRMRPVETRD